MIPALKSRWFSAWFARDAERRIARHFSALRVHGLAETRAIAETRPVLVVANHTAWWDPLLAIQLCVRALRVDAYAMMDAKNLRRLPFFARVGAFGVDREDPADGARAVRYAARRLDRPGRLVWIFPQGAEVPRAAPLVFHGGSAHVARVARRAAVVPVGIRYEHGAEPRPTAYVSFGPSLAYERDPARGQRAQEEAVRAELARIDDAIVRRDDRAFEPLLSRRPSRLQGIAEALLAWLTAPRALR